MGQKIQYPANGHQVPGYLALPEGGRGPGVIVLQEWWGLVPHIMDIADRLAKAGFVALAPDMYHGQSTQSPDEAGRLMMQLKIEQAAQDLRGAVKFLLGNPAVVGRKVGSMGFCMGGQLSLFAACTNPEVGACAIYYGIHPNIKPDYRQLKAPVLGFFAEKDPWVTPVAARALEADLKAAGAEVEFQIYEGVDHAFFNDSRPEVYDEAATADSWMRLLAFYRRWLA